MQHATQLEREICTDRHIRVTLYNRFSINVYNTDIDYILQSLALCSKLHTLD